jgi:hypothetical protein
MIGARRADERGMALAVAIFALVIIGALVAANFFAGRLEQQSGQNSLFARQAAEGAETGLREALAIIPASALAGLTVGGVPLDLGPTTISPSVRVERRVARLTSTLFFLRVLGTREDAAGNPLAARALGTLVRVIPDSVGGSPSVVRATQRGWVQLY